MIFTVISPERLLFLRREFRTKLVENASIKSILRIGISTLTLLILSIHLVQALPVKSQPVSQVKIAMELKHESLIQAFEKIEAQSHFRFMYRYKEVKDIRDLNFPYSEQSVEAFLKILLANTALTYRQLNDQILIMPIKNAAVDSTKKQISYIQPLSLVRGRVSNSKGDALVGVSIAVKGRTSGTSTDGNGNFSIDIAANSILVFSSIGYISQEVSVGSQTTMNIVLIEDSKSMNEVVVTALGIRREAKALTYATQTVKGDEITRTKDPSVINALQGKVPGLTITRSPNGPGSGSNVLLRGNRSITGNNAPLYVTDGVPGDIGLEDADNIESITVLKGASAAALYGSAGQNGAIIITTKRAAAGKLTVIYNGGLSFDKAQIFQDFQYQYGQGDAGIFVNNSEHSFGPKNDGQKVTLWNGAEVPLAGQPDRLPDFFRTGLTVNNSISISGGTDKSQTYFSYGDIEAGGIMRNNNLSRHIFNMRISNNITSRLSIDAKATYVNETVDNPPNDYAVTSAFRTPTSIPENQMKYFEYIDPDGNLTQNYWKPGSSILGNPYFYMYRDLSTTQNNQLSGLFSAKYNFTNWLDLSVRGNLTQTLGRGDNRIYSDSYFSLVGSDYSMSTGNRFSSYVDALLTFKHSLSKNFNLSGYFGGSVQGSKSDSTNSLSYGLVKDNFFFMGNAKAPIMTNTVGKSPQTQSLYGEATLEYKNYLFLDVTGRNDWSSALPKGSYSIFYPSVGLTAIISDMVQLPSWITYGKVRGSLANSGYGGNAYLGQPYYSVSAGGFVSPPLIASIGDYKPELTSSMEFGLDWRFLNNRLGLDLTYYRTQTKNQLLLINIPSASGFYQRYINAGLIQNSGLEFMLNFTPLKIGKFTWTGSLNYAKNDNKVIRLLDGTPSVVIQDDDIVTTEVEVGKSFGTLYAKGWQRDASNRKLVDDQGRPLLTSGKTIYVGNYNPNYMAGLSNTFTYGNISLSVLIDYRNGGTIIGGTQALIDADGHSARSLSGRENGIVLDAYTADGAKNDKSISSQTYFGSIGDRKPAAEEYAYSATNMRLRELSIGYVLPQSLYRGANSIKGIRLSLVGRNLFFFHKSTPFDPDIAQGRGGEESTALPFSRTLGFNLKVSF
jgi:TonB-linked SusC/RagA family outer membrane protein